MNLTIRDVILIVLTIFLFVALLTPFIRKIAWYIGALDIPKDNRRTHTDTVAKLGGLGIFSGFLLGYMLFSKQSIQMNSILIGSFIIVITGIIDDIKPLPAKYKFIGQLLAALIIPCYGGILLDNVTFLGLSFNFGIWSYPITIIFIVGLINCINFIDGLDGLSSGISSIYFLTIGIIAFVTNRLGGLDVVLAFIMLGACLGFLLHNFQPATIFAGECGSMFMGYIIAVIALLGFKNVTLTSLVIPLLILAIPILDTLFAIIRRLIKGIKITTPDKEHLHHQFLNMRFSHRNTVLIIYVIDILFASASVIYALKDVKLGVIIYSILFVIVIWLVTKTSVVVERNNLPDHGVTNGIIKKKNVNNKRKKK